LDVYSFSYVLLPKTPKPHLILIINSTGQKFLELLPLKA